MTINPKISALVGRIHDTHTAREAELLKHDVSQDVVTLALVRRLADVLFENERLERLVPEDAE